MKWLNIEIETLRGSEYLGAEPIERATWLSLMGWCAAQENGGEIPDCIGWGSRKWQQLCGVTKEEVEIGSELYSFEDGSLFVHFYPITQQAAVKAKREAGKKGGRPKKTDEPEPLKTKEEKPHGYENDNHKVTGSFNSLDNSLKGKHKRNSNSKVIVMEEEEKGKELILVSDETGGAPLPHSDKFKTSWEEWNQYLGQKRKKPTPMTIKKQLKILSKLSEPEAVNCINNSITNGWQGLFPDDLPTSKNSINPTINKKGKSQYA
jgi:hypothetical protein